MSDCEKFLQNIAPLTLQIRIESLLQLIRNDARLLMILLYKSLLILIFKLEKLFLLLI